MISRFLSFILIIVGSLLNAMGADFALDLGTNPGDITASATWNGTAPNTSLGHRGLISTGNYTFTNTVFFEDIHVVQTGGTIVGGNGTGAHSLSGSGANRSIWDISAGSVTSAAQFIVGGSSELLASGTAQINASDLRFLGNGPVPTGTFSGNSNVTLTGGAGLVLGFDYDVTFSDSAQLNGTQFSFGDSSGTITVSDSAMLTFSAGMVTPLANDTLRLDGGGQVSIAGNADFQGTFTVDFVSGATGSFTAGTLSGPATDYAGLITAGRFTIDGAAATPSQFDISGTTLSLAVPEPSLLSIVCAFLVMCALRRKR